MFDKISLVAKNDRNNKALQYKALNLDNLTVNNPENSKYRFEFLVLTY